MAERKPILRARELTHRASKVKFFQVIHTVRIITVNTLKPLKNPLELFGSPHFAGDPHAALPVREVGTRSSS